MLYCRDSAESKRRSRARTRLNSGSYIEAAQGPPPGTHVAGSFQLPQLREAPDDAVDDGDHHEDIQDGGNVRADRHPVSRGVQIPQQTQDDEDQVDDDEDEKDLDE